MKILRAFVLSSLVIIGASLAEAAPKGSKNPVVTIDTPLGTFEVELYMQEVPKTVQNFLTKVKKEHFNGTTFHRLVPQFVIQGGDPNSKDNDPSNDGYGGGQMEVEPRTLSNRKGTIAMASSSRQQPINSQSDSQFFINLSDNSPLDEMGFIPFGKVTKGMDIVDTIAKQKRDQRDRPVENISMKISLKP